MMTGKGPYGSVEMGGMFSMLKVRADLKPGDYSDPGWFQHPAGHQAFEYTGELPEISEGPSSTSGLMDANETFEKINLGQSDQKIREVELTRIFLVWGDWLLVISPLGFMA